LLDVFFFGTSYLLGAISPNANVMMNDGAAGFIGCWTGLKSPAYRCLVCRNWTPGRYGIHDIKRESRVVYKH